MSRPGGLSHQEQVRLPGGRTALTPTVAVAPTTANGDAAL